MTPDGIICHLSRPFPGRNHDLRMLRETSIEEFLNSLDFPADDSTGEMYHIFGDKGYSQRWRIRCPVEGNNLGPHERMYNEAMAGVRVAVENGFGEVSKFWALVNYKRTQRIQCSPIAKHYVVAVFLTNCRSCFYGNPISSRFECNPPDISEYVAGMVDRIE